MAEYESDSGENSIEEQGTQLLDLSWEDVIISNILPYLGVEDLLSLRCTSKAFSEITEMYISRMKTLRILNKKFTKRTFNIFQRCRKLSSINLCKTLSVTDNLLLPILEQNPRLSLLNLGHCANLTAKCLQPIITAKDPKLITLKLARCDWMTSGALDALSFHQRDLEDVDLSFCGNISEHSVQLFLKKFNRLRVLNVEGNAQITDTTLLAMSKFSKKMEVLNLSKCTNITNWGIRALASCPYLRGIRTVGCPRVSTTLNTFREQRHFAYDFFKDVGEVWLHH